MNFNGNFTETLEIDPSEIINEQEFLSLTKAELDRNGHIYLEVEVEYSGNYESSSCFGSWEDSLPDEFSVEVDGIYFEGENVAQFFGEELQEKIKELAENKACDLE